MRRNTISYRIVVLFIILLVSFFCYKNLCFAAENEEKNSKRVLFISSYSYSWGTVPVQIEGLQEALGTDYIINYEFMDTKNTVYSKNYKEYYDLLSYKLSKRESYDAVVVGDDAALNFVCLYKDELFPDLPIVFEGIDNIDNAKEAAKDPYITGIIERVDYKTNIQLATELMPDAQKLVFILDNAENGLGVQKQLKDAQDVLSDYEVTYINTSEYTKDDFCNYLSSLDDTSIVFCISMSQNKDGYIYTEEERYDILRQYSHIPMFRVSMSGVGKGTLLGGYIVSHRQSGLIAGNMVREALEEDDITDIPLNMDTPYEYYFDWNLLKEYQLDTSVIPASAIFINQEPSFLEEHYEQIITETIIILIFLLICMISYYAYNNRRNMQWNHTLDAKNRELENANVQLAKVNEYKSDFLSNMSHEIRTPMNAIIGMTKLAEDTAKDDKTKEYLREIDESSDYLLSVLNDVLDMSRIDNGKFELHREWAYASEVFWPCVDMLEPEMRAKGIEFVHPDTKKITNLQFYVDILRTKQIVMNLLNNAYKFTPAGGKISLEIHNLNKDESRAVDQIIVRDTGCGMSEDFLQRIFQPFEQERNAYSEQIKGTGLGLALVKRIIDAMGGSIKVESTLGKGSVFIIDFPYEYRIKNHEKTENEEITDTSILNGKHVLLVDDHPLNQKIARALLEKQKVVVELACNGRQAMEQFELSSVDYYDAILMDIRMPEIDGLTATRRIRQLNRADAKKIPIIAMTANAFEEDMKKSKDAGMNAHLAKPIEPEKLYRTLINYMENVE